ncbi:esterase [Catenovulum sediminis]|uniref:esterase n=1 Tax=Catenovulum sediminis TaxID=1740262 RepID=UPI00117EDA8D|nr:esterase [Catenovulum sediminis]
MFLKFAFGSGALRYIIAALALTGCIQTSPTAPNSLNASHSSSTPRAAQAQQKNQYVPGNTLYIRGGFNGWSAATPLLQMDGKPGVFSAQAKITIGNHGFKIAPSDWAYEWVVNGNQIQMISLNKTYPLQLAGGPEDSLFVEKTGVYQFILDMQDKSQPYLTVKLLKTIGSGEKAPHVRGANKVQLEFSTFDEQLEGATFSIQSEENGLRTYVHSTTQALRDPVPQYSVYAEDAELPYSRSGNIAFDALFALAIDEMKLDSVSEIKDGNYNAGQPIACECFETGEKWNYVWTRDLSYAADLSLAMLDPVRVKNSLEFKTSSFRENIQPSKFVKAENAGLQIIQDTGSGGSWPVSTDRMTWAFGAEAALNNLPPKQRKALADVALPALVGSIENDRLAAFNPELGLYMGEQSFLDWREQSYANWIVNDLSSMASAVSLSTNAGHYQALQLAARLANEKEDQALAQKYAVWAEQLKQAINQHLWLAEAGMYSSLTAAHFDYQPMAKFDWLGQSLAIVSGIADQQKTQEILANYPHGPMGAPVIFPQQPGIPIYHNRAIWPFVTAYGLKAAKIGQNTEVANAAYETLMRAAALNLSNMENLEWLSAQPIMLDKQNPQLSGPVINSKRQLWSVAAYLSLVVNQVYGLEATADGLKISPFITAKLRREWFSEQTEIALKNYDYKGKKLNVKLLLPTKTIEQGGYTVDNIKLNNKLVSDTISLQQLDKEPVNQLIVQLKVASHYSSQITRVESHPLEFDEQVFAPYEPKLAVIKKAHHVEVQLIDKQNLAGRVEYTIYRNGVQVASQLTASKWLDSDPNEGQNCYSASAQFKSSGNKSHHSQVMCTEAAKIIPVDAANVRSTVGLKNAERGAYIADWGAQQDVLSVNEVQISKAGLYAIQVNYANHANAINLGISNGVKWMQVTNSQTGKIVAEGVVQLPHTQKNEINLVNNLSTPLNAKLKKGSYTIKLQDFYNMSYLKSNKTFTGTGGINGIFNKFDIYAVTLMLLPLK